MAELSPDYLRDVPVDPFAERPLTYARTPTGYTLRSLGLLRWHEGECVVLDLGSANGTRVIRGGEVIAVPPDPARQAVDDEQYRELHDTGRQADAHGFALRGVGLEAAFGDLRGVQSAEDVFVVGHRSW